jgi:hypothetical protein
VFAVAKVSPRPTASYKGRCQCTGPWVARTTSQRRARVQSVSASFQISRERGHSTSRRLDMLPAVKRTRYHCFRRSRCTMLKKLWTVGFLLLAVSPFTAPFRTYEAPPCGNGHAGLLHSSLHDGTDPDSEIAPRIRTPGRLSIAPQVGLTISCFNPRCPLASPAPLSAATCVTSNDSILFTVLRL